MIFAHLWFTFILWYFMFLIGIDDLEFPERNALTAEAYVLLADEG